MQKHPRRDDTIEVVTGRDRGKKGKVLSVLTEKDRIFVQGINFMKKALRPTKDNPKGGIHQVEGSIHVSNVRLICPRCNKPTRVRGEKRKDGKRVRVCRKCGEEL